MSRHRVTGTRRSTIAVGAACLVLGGLVAVGFTALGTGSSTANVLVQSTGTYAYTANDSVAKHYDAPVQAGDLLEVSVAWDAAGSPDGVSASDTLGNDWVPDSSIHGAAADRSLAVFHTVAASSGDDTVTVSFGAARTQRYIAISEYAVEQPTPPSSTAPTTAPPTTTAAPTTVPPTTAPPTTAPPTTPPSSSPPAGFPDASTTGVPDGTSLHICSTTISQPGTYSGCSFSDSVEVTASNVTIKNSRVTVSGNTWGVGLRHANNVVIDHVDITSPSASGSGRLEVGVKDVYGDAVNPTVQFCDISHTSTGVQFNNGLIADNYIHDMGLASGDHINGTTSNAGSGSSTRPLIIRHNTVLNQIGQTDAVSLFEDFGAQNYATIDNNLLAGGGYTIYGGQNAGGTATHDIQVTNNRISTRYFPNGGSYGPAAAWNSGGKNNLWSGNVWADGSNAGKTITAP